jgi:hypothetical protein
MSIVIRTDAGVDVFSDNTLRLAVLPPTTSRQHRERHTRSQSPMPNVQPGF